MVDKNEVWGSSLCFWVWYLPKGQGWLYEAWRASATTKYSRMKVGRYKHGFLYGFTNDNPQVWFDLGDHRSTLQIYQLHTYDTSYKVQKYVEIYIARVLCLHRVPKTIIFDRGSQFVAHFWEQLHDASGLTWSTIRPITHRRMAKLSVSTKYLKICL
jgi:hypothetical protein